MKTTLILLALILSLPSYAVMICIRNELYLDNEPFVKYLSNRACQDALSESKNSYLCHGANLYNIKNKSLIATFDRAEDCSYAVQQSKP